MAGDETMSDIKEFHKEYMQEIYARSGAENDFNEAVVTENMSDFRVAAAAGVEFR